MLLGEMTPFNNPTVPASVKAVTLGGTILSLSELFDTLEIVAANQY